MLAVTISLFFALSASFAVFAIVHTFRSQLANVAGLLEQARNVRAERNFAVRFSGVGTSATVLVKIPRRRHAARSIISRAPLATQPLRAAA